MILLQNPFYYKPLTVHIFLPYNYTKGTAQSLRPVRGLFCIMITPESANLARILGMGAAEFDIPLRFSMFEEVANHFNDPKTANIKILRILAKNPSKDSLEAVWRYVRLENEKLEAIKTLNPVEFEDDIAEELKQGALSLASIKRIEEDMAKREATPAPIIEEVNPSLVNALQHTEKRNVIKIQNPDYSTAGLLGTSFNKIRETLETVKNLNQTIEKYG